MYAGCRAGDLNSGLGNEALGPNQSVVRPISREGEYIIYGPMRWNIYSVKARGNWARNSIREIRMW